MARLLSTEQHGHQENESMQTSAIGIRGWHNAITGCALRCVCKNKFTSLLTSCRRVLRPTGTQANMTAKAFKLGAGKY